MPAVRDEITESSVSSRRRPRTFLLPLVAACLGLVALSGCADAGSDAHPVHRVFPLDGGGKALTIDSDDGDVVVRPADVKGVDVTRWFDGHTVIGQRPSATWAMEGGTLKLRTHCAGLVSSCSVRHEILVPRDVAVTVSCGNGAVEASGFAAPLKVTTGNGTVSVDGATGTLALDSHNGKVVATGLRSRQVRAGTANGRVRLGFAAVPDRVEGTSHNGSVTVDLPRAAYRVTAETGNGRTRVDVPQDPRSGHVVTARSDNGGVAVRTSP